MTAKGGKPGSEHKQAIAPACHRKREAVAP